MSLGKALDAILSSPGKLRLLRTLYASPNRRWTGRELARACGVSSAQTARDLSDFLDSGLVVRDVIGRTYSWRLNEDLVIGRALGHLFEVERALPQLLRTEIREALRRAPIREARLFGSVPRGVDTPESDVDLFIEVESEQAETRVRDAIESARTRVWMRFGLPLSPLIYRSEESKSSSASALIRAIKHEGTALE